MANINGTSGADVLNGFASNDFIRGFGASDTISGLGGNDRVFGGGGADLLQGSFGDDLLAGDTGDDTLQGNRGNDGLFGNSKNDVLWGGGGEDTLHGGTGDDILRGGFDDDTLIGGAGIDRFLIGSAQGTETILDFEDGIDKIRLLQGNRLDGLTFSDLKLRRAGQSTHIFLDKPSNRWDGSLMAIVDNIAPNQITADDIYTPNTAPIAQDDTLIGLENALITGDVLADNGSGIDSDPDGNPLEIVAFNGSASAVGNATAIASGALVTLNSDGTFTYDPNGAFDALKSAETTTDSFTYTLSDGNGGSDTATVTVDLTGINDAPVITSNDSTTVNEGETFVLDRFRLEGTDPDDGTEELTYTVDSNPTNGQLELVADPGNSITSFTQSDINNGRVQYVHDGSETTSDSFDFTLADGGEDGATSASGIFEFIVDPVNDAPSFTVGPDEEGDPGDAVSVHGWASDISSGSGESGQALTFNVTGNTNPGLFSVAPAIDELGNLTYTLAGGADGTATVTVELMDDGGTANGGVDTSAPQTFTITASESNDQPSFTAGPDQFILDEDAGTLRVNNWATNLSPGPASESGQALTFNVTGNTNTDLFSVAPAIDSSGKLTFTLANNANGTATVTVELMDDGGTANGGNDTSAPQTFTITAIEVNDEPSFTVGPDQTVLEDAGAIEVNNWATNLSSGPANESGQALTFNVTDNTNPGLFSVAPAIDASGNLTYTVADDANGTATITLTLSDDGGTANGGVDTSASQTFTITATAVNDEPSFTVGPDQTVLEDAGATVVNNWATNISPGPASESGQALTFNVTGNTNASLFSVAPAIDSSGNLTFTTADNASGTATVTVELMDDGGTANGGDDTSAPQTFTITATEVNDEPSFTAADQTVDEDAGATAINNWATNLSPGPASESGQALTFNLTGYTNTDLFSVAPAIDSSGNLTFTPADDANGTATVTVELMDDGGTANGGNDTSAPQEVTIIVNSINDDPVARTDVAYTVLDQPVTIDVLSNDFDPEGDEISFSFVSRPLNGSAVHNGNGIITYTPGDYDGWDSFEYTITDDNGGSATGTVFVDVSSVS